MITKETLNEKLDALEGYLEQFKAFKKYSREIFVNEPALYDLAERYLYLTGVCIVNIGNHLISDLKLGSVSNYSVRGGSTSHPSGSLFPLQVDLPLAEATGGKDIFMLLEKNNIISNELSKKLQAWMDYRSIMFRSYFKIDYNIIYDTILNDFSEIEEFKEIVEGLI